MAYYSPKYYTPSTELYSSSDTPQKTYYDANFYDHQGLGYGGFRGSSSRYYSSIPTYSPQYYHSGFQNNQYNHPSNTQYVPKTQGYSEFVPVNQSYVEYVPEHKIEYRPVVRHRVDYQEVRHETDFIKSGPQQYTPIKKSYIGSTRYSSPGYTYPYTPNNFARTQSVNGLHQTHGYYNNQSKYI